MSVWAVMKLITSYFSSSLGSMARFRRCFWRHRLQGYFLSGLVNRAFVALFLWKKGLFKIGLVRSAAISAVCSIAIETICSGIVHIPNVRRHRHHLKPSSPRGTDVSRGPRVPGQSANAAQKEASGEKGIEGTTQVQTQGQ